MANNTDTMGRSTMENIPTHSFGEGVLVNGTQYFIQGWEWNPDFRSVHITYGQHVDEVIGCQANAADLATVRKAVTAHAKRNVNRDEAQS
jgi:hypothetical protein